MNQDSGSFREWIWEGEFGTYGVHTRERMLIWWFQPAADSGRSDSVVRGQSFHSFLRRGPALDFAPAEVVEAVRAFLLESLEPES